MRRSIARPGSATALVLAAAGAALWSCGGIHGGSGGSGGTCGGKSTCGGNLQGSWSITSICDVTGVARITSSCPQAPIDSSGLRVTGSLDLQSDMTFTSTATLNGNVTVAIPTACLTSDGVTFTCEELDTVLQGIQQGIGGSCISATGGCACTIQFTSFTTTGTGTYATTDSTLTTTSSVDGGPPGTTIANYCVQGSTLTLTSTAASAASGLFGELAGEVVAEEQ